MPVHNEVKVGPINRETFEGWGFICVCGFDRGFYPVSPISDPRFPAFLGYEYQMEILDVPRSDDRVWRFVEQ